MGLLGMGNGAVFQIVPQRFSKEIGVVTGIVGAAGGIGGFVLPNLLGSMKQATGSFSGGFLTFALVGCFGCAAVLLLREPGLAGWFDRWQADQPAEVPAPLGTLVEADAFA